MSNTALITGASSGIGEAFARHHANQGGNLVLVARRQDALEALQQELQSKHGIQVTVIPADLSEPDSAEKIFAATEAAGITVDILINNAGFGGHGKFHQRELVKDQAMMQVNMVSLVNLTHRYLQGMVQRKHGRILNVASTAAFMPGPLQAVYYATKSFVVSFTQAIAEELSGTNVTATVLCPGAVATGFQSAGDLQGVDLWDKAKSPESVAECGYKAMEKGELVKINEGGLKFMIDYVLPMMPRKTLLKVSRKAMEKN